MQATGRINQFELLGSYSKEKGWTFTASLIHGNIANPIEMLQITDAPDVLKKLLNFNRVFLSFRPKQELLICLAAQANVDLLSFGDSQIFKINDYQIDFHKSFVPQRQSFFLRVEGNIELLAFPIYFEGTFNSQDKSLKVFGKLSKRMNLFEAVSDLTEGTSFPLSIFVDEGSSVSFDS